MRRDRKTKQISMTHVTFSFALRDDQRDTGFDEKYFDTVWSDGGKWKFY